MTLLSRMIIVFAALVLVFSFSSNAMANHGKFVVCNKSGSKVYMFVSYRKGLDVLRDRWRVTGPFAVGKNSCIDLFSSLSDWLHMYVAFKKKGLLPGVADYVATLDSNNNFVRSSSAGKKCV